MEENLGKSFWKETAKYGGMLGLTLTVILLFNAYTEFKYASTTSLLNFAAMAYFLYFFGKKRSLKYGATGFTYGQSMGFMVVMLIFAGFILGIGDYFAFNYIAPEYFTGKVDELMDSLSKIMYDESVADNVYDMVMKFLKNPLLLVLNEIASTVLAGVFVALIASIFVKRSPDYFVNGQ